MSEYLIKQKPEDFVVKENSSLKFVNDASGEYSVFRMRKREYTTERAVQQIADNLHIDRKKIGYAGAKDSKALTEQLISIRGVDKGKIEHLGLKDISLEFVGFINKPISLGDLEGNSFEIIARGLDIAQKPKSINRIVNYFGEQRFSKNNAEIGKAIIKKDFKRAVDRVLESIGREEEKVIEHLQKNKNDFVGALKRIPWKTLNMYIHAYQSKLWNEMTKEIVSGRPPIEAHRDNSPDSTATITLPLIGFATEIEDKELNSSVDRILQSEDVTKDDFVIRAIPELSSAGSERKLFAEVNNLSIGELEDDDLNPDKKKIKITFSLGKGSYATEVIKALLA